MLLGILTFTRLAQQRLDRGERHQLGAIGQVVGAEDVLLGQEAGGPEQADSTRGACLRYSVRVSRRMSQRLQVIPGACAGSPPA
jgi:hypothetical protein